MSLTPNELLDIKKIIQFGARSPENYNILFYKAIYSRDVSVRIRGLSNYEYDEISLEMYADVKDAATIRYLFNPKNEEKTKKVVEEEKQPKSLKEQVEDIDKMEEKEKSELDREIPDDVNTVELTKAYSVRNALIVFHAMKDYYPNITLNDVKQMEGIDEIANRVNEKSGRTKVIREQIEFFRREQRKLRTTLPSIERT